MTGSSVYIYLIFVSVLLGVDGVVVVGSLPTVTWLFSVTTDISLSTSILL